METTNLNGKFILIEDSINANAKNIINYLTSNVQNVKFLCIERPAEKWKSIVTMSNCEYFTNVSALKGVIPNFTESTVVLDSINQIAIMSGWEECLKFIDLLNKADTIKRVFLILHNDCLIFGEKMLKHLKYISQTHIILKCLVLSKNIRAEITSISTGGKITRTENEIYFDDASNKWMNIKIAKNATIDKKDIMINSMTSFKISIEKQAEAVKSDLILPYTEINKLKNNLVMEPDYEDWDDEDPDYDLSI